MNQYKLIRLLPFKKLLSKALLLLRPKKVELETFKIFLRCLDFVKVYSDLIWNVSIFGML